VTAVQVECWGAGGAGGSAQRVGGSGTVQFGGGGAGGAYAKVTNYPVIPGNTYYINVGTCALNTNSVTGVSVSGGNSWFNSVNSTNSLPVLAKGGSGGNSAIGNSSTTALGTGGAGSTNGSIGNVLYAGGNGASAAAGAAGGGGSRAGYATNGSSATSNVGATDPLGGGDGGTGVTSGSLSGTAGSAPGGGGGGSRNSDGTLSPGAPGGSGQVILTLRMKTNSTISISGGTFTYNTFQQGPGLESVTWTGSANSNLTYRYEGVAPTLYSASSTRPTNAGTYTVTATLPEDSNFMAAVSTPTPFTIAPATPTFTPPPSAQPDHLWPDSGIFRC